MFSVGCIIAEMFLGSPIFMKLESNSQKRDQMKDDFEQFQVVVRELGMPSEDAWPELISMPRWKDFSKVSCASFVTRPTLNAFVKN